MRILMATVLWVLSACVHAGQPAGPADSAASSRTFVLNPEPWQKICTDEKVVEFLGVDGSGCLKAVDDSVRICNGMIAEEAAKLGDQPDAGQVAYLEGTLQTCFAMQMNGRTDGRFFALLKRAAATRNNPP